MLIFANCRPVHQIRYPVNQRQARGMGARYRVTGASGVMAGGFNQKGPQRIASKQKKLKPKKDEKKSISEEDEAEKKTILKERDENPDDKIENG